MCQLKTNDTVARNEIDQLRIEAHAAEALEWRERSIALVLERDAYRELGQASMGDTITRAGVAGLSDLNQIAHEQQVQEDRTATMRAGNQLLSWVNQRLRAPDGGALHVRGLAAKDQLPLVEKEYKETAAKIAQNLKGNRQRLMFEADVANRWESVSTELSRHASNEFDQYRAAEAENGKELRITNAIGHYKDPVLIAKDIDQGVAIILDQHLGPEATRRAIETFTTAIHEGVIDRHLADQNDRTARLYYETVTEQTRADGDRRPDGTTKGDGYFGVLQRPDGRVSTELSIGVEIDGKETQIPTLVPTLTKEEVETLLALDDREKIPDAIADKAEAYARKRIAEGKSPFAGAGEQDASLYSTLKRSAPQPSPINGPAQARITKALKEGSTRGEAQRQADAIVASGGTLKEQRDKAKAIEDPEVRDKALTYIEQEATIRERETLQSDRQKHVEIGNLIDRGGLKAVPASTWATLTVDQKENYERYAKRNMKAGDPDGHTDPVLYYGLLRQAAEQPDAFAKLNLADPKYLAHLGKTDFKHVVGVQTSILKGDRKSADEQLDGYRTVHQIAMGALREAGIDTSDSQAAKASGDSERAARFERRLNERVMHAQRIIGKKVTNQDAQDLADQLLMEIAFKYYQNGRAIRESTETTKETVARRMLRRREGDVEHGIPIVPKMGRIIFDDAAKDLLNDYTVNGKKSHDHVKRRIDLALEPVFKGRRMIGITTADIRAYIRTRLARRCSACNWQAQDATDAVAEVCPTCGKPTRPGAAPATINRELAALKRMFTLAVQAGKLHAKPYIPMLREDNVRRGFFEPEQFESMRAKLPEALRPLVTFAYLTGWRLKGEILPLEWRQVDWTGRVVRLDPGTTKNREGRSFPFTAALEALLKEQLAEHERLKKQDPPVICRFVFHREGERIRNFRRAWASACKAAHVPGRILHDFRRTAVRNLERAGVPRSSAMAMVGHKTEAIYRRYAIVDAGALRDAATKIDRAAAS